MRQTRSSEHVSAAADHTHAAHIHLLNGRDAAAALEVARAQAEATIALAEEQRTANLIAAFNRDAINAPRVPDSGRTTDREYMVAVENRRLFWDRLADTITERLGLSE